MRYLFSVMLLTALVGCGDNGDHRPNAGATTSETSPHDHDHEDEHEQVKHFEGKPAKDWEEAIAHLKQYNKKLKAKLEQEKISGEDLADIHKWSYTMENAVGRLRAELKSTAEHLEKVHLASERGGTDRVREQGRKYLERLAPLLETPQARRPKTRPTSE